MAAGTRGGVDLLVQVRPRPDGSLAPLFRGHLPVLLCMPFPVGLGPRRPGACVHKDPSLFLQDQTALLRTPEFCALLKA